MLRNTDNITSIPVSIEAVCQACERGDLAVLQHWHTDDKLPPLMLLNSNGWCPHELAIQHGHLEVLKWLILDSGQAIDLMTEDLYSATLAVRHGHLAVIQWLLTECPQDVTPIFNATTAAQTAADAGHLEVLKWLVKDSGFVVDLAAQANKALRQAEQKAHSMIVNWIINDSGQILQIRKAGRVKTLLAAYEDRAKIQLRQHLEKTFRQRTDKLCAEPACVQAYVAQLATTPEALEQCRQMLTTTSAKKRRL